MQLKVNKAQYVPTSEISSVKISNFSYNGVFSDFSYNLSFI